MVLLYFSLCIFSICYCRLFLDYLLGLFGIIWDYLKLGLFEIICYWIIWISDYLRLFVDYLWIICFRLFEIIWNLDYLRLFGFELFEIVCGLFVDYLLWIICILFDCCGLFELCAHIRVWSPSLSRRKAPGSTRRLGPLPSVRLQGPTTTE